MPTIVGVRFKYAGKVLYFDPAGSEPVEGTDAWKLKLTLKNGDVQYYYMDTDYFVPIKIEIKRMIRGAEQEAEITLGDYKEVAGWYLPHSIEQGRKGSQNRAKTVYQKIEANVPMDEQLFHQPATPAVAK